LSKYQEQLLEERVDDPVELEDTLQQSVLARVSQQRVFIIEEVEHDEEADLVEIEQLALRRQPPEEREPPDRGFLLGHHVHVETADDYLREELREGLREVEDQVDDLVLVLR